MSATATEITGLDQILLAVRDCDTAAETLSRLLGRPASWRGSRENGELESALFELPNSRIHLVAPAGEGASARAIEEHLERWGEGQYGLAFRCARLAPALERARSRGLTAGPEAESQANGAAEGSWCAAALGREGTFGTPLFLLEREDSPEAPLRRPSDARDRPSDPSGEPGRVESLDHVVLLSAGLEAMAALYGDALGLRLALDRDFPKRGVRLLFFRTGGTTVEIGGPLEPPENAGSGARFGGLAWRVADVAAARARLVDAGLPVSEVRSGHKAGTRVFTVKGGTLGVPTLVIGAGLEAS